MNQIENDNSQRFIGCTTLNLLRSNTKTPETMNSPLILHIGGISAHCIHVFSKHSN